MSYDELIPVGALDTPGEQPAARDPRHELICECVSCGQTVLVCCYVGDLDPALYKCLDCRPFKDEQPDERAADLAEAIERARGAQHGGVTDRRSAADIQAAVAAASGDAIPF